MFGNITLFGVAVDHIHCATPNSVILPHRSPDSGSFVIIFSNNVDLVMVCHLAMLLHWSV